MEGRTPPCSHRCQGKCTCHHRHMDVWVMGFQGFNHRMSMGCIHLFHRLWQHMRYHMYILVLNIGIHKYPMEFLPKYIHMDIQLCHGQ